MTGPAPDLSGYPATDDDVYEWLLSDHPWARAERRRRAQDRHTEDTTRAAQVRHWVDTTDQHSPGAPGRTLAELLRPSADETHLRAEIRSAEPDDLSVQHDRKAYEQERRAGGEDYHYPAHLIGPDAVRYPPPKPQPAP